MKSFLFLISALFIPESTFSYPGSIHGCCPFLMFEQMEHALLQHLSDKDRAIENKENATVQMNEKDDSVELIFKSPEFLTVESLEKESITIRKQYNPLNVITALCLKTNFFSAIIKPKSFENGTGLCVTISEKQSGKHCSYSSYFRKQAIIPSLLAIEKVSAEFDKQQGTLTVMIPKNSVNIQVAESIVPITVIPAQP